jgi:putative ABC transport system substrate-binding protein
LLFLLLLSTIATLAAGCGTAKPPQPPRVGYLGFGAYTAGFADLTDAFRAGLAELGYVEGRNIIVEYRYAEGQTDRLEPYLDELLKIPVDVVVLADSLTIPIAKRKTSKVPIVMAVSGDPVGEGFAASLARPGGNITGLSNLSGMLSGKRVELLRDAVPTVSRLAVLGNPDNPTDARQLEETALAAQALALDTYTYRVRTPDEIDQAFADMPAQEIQGVLVLPSPLTTRERVRIARLALDARLPSIFGLSEGVQAGGLMSYGPDRKAMFYRVASYVDKIVRGTAPGMIPVEQPTRFELTLNLKTASALELSIPERILMQVSDVVR